MKGYQSFAITMALFSESLSSQTLRDKVNLCNIS
jgi:hypothetical protein